MDKKSAEHFAVGCIDTKKIYEFLNKNKISKTAFCRQNKIDIGAFNKILNNQGHFNLTTLCKVGSGLGLRLCEMFVKCK